MVFIWFTFLFDDLRVFLPSFVVASSPTNLTVELAGTNNISVSWTATATGPAVIGFRIYYQAQGDQGSVYLDATSTEYIVTNCTIGQQYNITVVALSENLPSTVVGPESFIIGEMYTGVSLQFVHTVVHLNLCHQKLIQFQFDVTSENML